MSQDRDGAHPDRELIRDLTRRDVLRGAAIGAGAISLPGLLAA